MKNLNLRSAALILIACLSLGVVSCSTTTGNVAAKTTPVAVNGNSLAKDVADGALGVAGATLGTSAFVAGKIICIALYPLALLHGQEDDISDAWESISP
jgi:hypothetical protein